jgi:hypothetical protein
MEEEEKLLTDLANLGFEDPWEPWLWAFEELTALPNVTVKIGEKEKRFLVVIKGLTEQGRIGRVVVDFNIEKREVDSSILFYGKLFGKDCLPIYPEDEEDLRDCILEAQDEEMYNPARVNLYDFYFKCLEIIREYR